MAAVKNFVRSPCRQAANPSETARCVSYDDLQLAADCLALHFLCCGLWSVGMLVTERFVADAIPKDNIYFATVYLVKHVFTLLCSFQAQSACLGMPRYPYVKIAIEFGTAVFCMFVFLKHDVPFGSCSRRRFTCPPTSTEESSDA